MTHTQILIALIYVRDISRIYIICGMGTYFFESATMWHSRVLNFLGDHRSRSVFIVERWFSIMALPNKQIAIKIFRFVYDSVTHDIHEMQPSVILMSRSTIEFFPFFLL